jgi:hypothetical protein
MNYRVIWSPRAEAQLAAVWTAAPNRNDVSVMADLLERSIGSDPFRVGRWRASSVNRVVTASPLGLLFDIVEDDKKVIVQALWFVPDR